jgi:hypothetical protein
MDLLVRPPTACWNRPLRVALPKETPDLNPLQIRTSSSSTFRSRKRTYEQIHIYDFPVTGVEPSNSRLNSLGYDLLAL